MNKIKLLANLFIYSSVLYSNVCLSQTEVQSYPEFKPFSSMPNENEVTQEFKSLNLQIKSFAEKNQTCSAQVVSALKNQSKNRGLADESHFYQGICKELAGDFTNAKEEYKTSLKLKRSNKEAIFRLAYLSLLDKDYKTTISLSDETLWMKFANPTLPLFLKAVSYSMLNENDESKKTLDLLEKTNNKFIPSLGLRKKLLLAEIAKTNDPSKKKQLRDAYNQILPKLLASDPNNKTYSLEYARFLLSQGHPLHNPQALNQGISLTRKYSRTGGLVDEAFLLLEIQFLEKQGKLAEAKGILDELNSVNPLSPSMEFKRSELNAKLNPDSEVE